MCCAIVVHKVGEMRGGLGQSASLRFLSPLIELDERGPPSGSPTGFTARHAVDNKRLMSRDSMGARLLSNASDGDGHVDAGHGSSYATVLI